MIIKPEFEKLFYPVYSHDEKDIPTLTGKTISLSDFLKQNPQYYSRSTRDENQNRLIELKNKKKNISIRIPAELYED